MKFVNLFADSFRQSRVILRDLTLEELVCWYETDLTDLYAERLKQFVYLCIRMLPTKHHLHCQPMSLRILLVLIILFLT